MNVLREWIVSTLGGGATALGIVVALIGLFGALGGAIASVFVGQKSIYVNSITVERMKWIGGLKDNLSKLIAQAHHIMNKTHAHEHVPYSVAEMIDNAKDIFTTRSIIQLQLNPFGKIDSNISYITEAIQQSISQSDENKKNLKMLERALLWHSQWLFKIEWEKVKREAQSPLARLLSQNRVKRLEEKYDAAVESEGMLHSVRKILKKERAQSEN